MPEAPIAHPRCAALVGPYGTGKSALFEALLPAAGHPARRAANGRAHVPGTETRIGHASFLGDPWTLLDCPGSIEFLHATAAAAALADIAVLVVDPAPERAIMAAPHLRLLEQAGVPTLVMIHKIDTLPGLVRDTVAALQAHSTRPLLLRQVPWREGGRIVGYIDLVSERA